MGRGIRIVSIQLVRMAAEDDFQAVEMRDEEDELKVLVEDFANTHDYLFVSVHGNTAMERPNYVS